MKVLQSELDAAPVADSELLAKRAHERAFDKIGWLAQRVLTVEAPCCVCQFVPPSSGGFARSG